MAASCKAVLPLLFCKSRSAPPHKSMEATNLLSWMAAKINGVFPWTSTTLTSALHSTSKPPAAASPFLAAQCKAVLPKASLASISKSSLSIKTFMAPMSPEAAASKIVAMDDLPGDTKHSSNWFPDLNQSFSGDSRTRCSYSKTSFTFVMYIYSLCDWSIEDFGYISWHLGLYESGSKTFHRLCGQSSASSTSQAPRHALATWKENAGGRFQAPVFFLPKETRHRFTTQHNFLLSKERRKPRIKQGTTPNKLASALQLGWRWPNALRSSFKKHPCAWYDDTTSSSYYL